MPVYYSLQNLNNLEPKSFRRPSPGRKSGWDKTALNFPDFGGGTQRRPKAARQAHHFALSAAPICRSLAPKGGEKEDRVRGGEETLISEISTVIVDPPRRGDDGKEDKTGRRDL